MQFIRLDPEWRHQEHPVPVGLPDIFGLEGRSSLPLGLGPGFELRWEGTPGLLGDFKAPRRALKSPVTRSAGEAPGRLCPGDRTFLTRATSEIPSPARPKSPNIGEPQLRRMHHSIWHNIYSRQAQSPKSQTIEHLEANKQHIFGRISYKHC